MSRKKGMPLQTFLNLPEERRKEIIRVCLAEFARNDYESASLSRIIKALRLAKGSFYRYFESKEALYLYLFDFTRDLLNVNIDKNLGDADGDFFEAWVEFSLDTFRMEKEYPLYLRFLSRFSHEKWETYYGVHGAARLRMRLQFATEILEAYQEKGNIRSDISIEMLGFALLGLRTALRDYLSFKYEMDLENPDRMNISGIAENQIESDIKIFTKVMRGALGVPAAGVSETD